ncbi:IS5 family transposase [Nitrospirillum iridis]|uniref:IS5 family transposase n=1 Tax=Nitrospirillum iridis TaxID=765888 RepID=A0A7X0AYW3_9PROT|nr:IS5 family transposase [Nitrospirillum iridis]MBB6251891.1 IS5 family transposase [Nitrospirillum iridis]
MPRDLRQTSFADGLVNQRAGRLEWLSDVERLVEWRAIDRLLESVYASDEGRPSYPLRTLVKLLLLQQWYGLSGPGWEEAVDDRLSFRRFAGLPLDEGVPDHSTIWRFRQCLAKDVLSEQLFGEVTRQLDARGLVVRRGTLMDASIVKAAVKPPACSEGTVSERDPDAGWTTKNGESTFGYKAHGTVDAGANLIRAAVLTSAEVHGSQVARTLIQGDEEAVHADKAYDSQALRNELAAAGIKSRILRRAARNKPLTPAQFWFNKAMSPIRAGVERAFATMKRHYRYRGAATVDAPAIRVICT